MGEATTWDQARKQKELHDHLNRCGTCAGRHAAQTLGRGGERWVCRTYNRLLEEYAALFGEWEDLDA